MAHPLKVLVAEDDPADAELLLRELKRAGFDFIAKQVETEADYRVHIAEAPDLVIADFQMPQFSGLRALEILKEAGQDVPFILVSGTIGEETAVAAMKQGASDYLLKDRLGRLGQAVQQALDANRLRADARKAEEALRASEQLFRSTLENMMEGCQIVGRDWRYVYLNEIAAGHGQKPVEKLIGRTMQESFPGIEKSEMFSVLERCMADGQPREYDNQFTYEDGSSAWFHLFIQAVPEGLFILSLDITARRQIEDALRSSEARFREMLQNVGLIAITLDEQGRITFANDYLLRLTGWSRDELMGGNWFETFLLPSDVETPRLFRTSIQIGKMPARHENPIRTRSGELKEIAWNNAALRDANGILRGVASIGEDITEKKEAAEKIRVQLDELRRWQEVTLGREDRVMALKAEINELLARQKQPPRYTATNE